MGFEPENIDNGLRRAAAPRRRRTLACFGCSSRAIRIGTAVIRSLQNLAVLCLLALAVLGSTPSRSDEPACATAPAWTPCQLFPPGPSIADHSGYHDHEFFWILFNAYADEWNRMPPSDPDAPPTRRPEAEVPPVPMTSPPMPFTDWPIGATQIIGGATPNSVDSPLMDALIGGTPVGKPLEDAHVQIYGWIDGGREVSSATHR